jgi:hypothetical protein
MKLISKKGMASFYKASPLVALGFGVFFVLFIVSKADHLGDAVPVVIFFLVAFFVLKLSFKNIVEEVYDCGDFLLIKNNHTEEKIPFKNIENITYSRQQRGGILITLHLLYPGKFGSRITFIPNQGRTYLFKKPSIVEELLQRAKTAKSGAVTGEFVLRGTTALPRNKSSVEPDRSGLVGFLVVITSFCGLIWWGWNDVQPPESVVQDYYQSIADGKDNCDFRSMFINGRVQYTNKINGSSKPALERFEAQVFAARNGEYRQSTQMEILSKEFKHAVISAKTTYDTGRSETEVFYLNIDPFGNWVWKVIAIEKIQ